MDILAAIAYSQSRAKTLAFSKETVLTNYGQVFVPSKSGIQSILDLKGRTISVLKDDIHYQALSDLLKKFQVKVDFLFFNDYDQVMKAVEQGKAHAGVANRLWGQQSAKNYQVHPSPIVFNPIELRFASLPENKALLSILDKHLAEYKKNVNSPYYQTLNRWLAASGDFKVPFWVYWSLALVLLVALFFLMASVFLRKQVNKQTHDLKVEKDNLKQEVGERIRAEQALRESEGRFRDIFDFSGDAIFIHDLDGKILEVNQAANRYYGFTRDEFLKVKLKDLIAPAYSYLLPERMKLVEGKGQVVFESVHLRKDDLEFPVEVNSRRMIFQGQTCILGIVRDLTERKKTEARLRQAQKMEAVGTLAGGIAHDFNNILAAIMGFAELARMDAQQGKVNPDDLERILFSANRAKKLVQQILTFSNKVEPECRPLDLNQAIEHSLELLRHTIPQKVGLNLALSANLRPVEADRSQIGQVILSLANNAFQAMPKGGELKIETQNISHDNNSRACPTCGLNLNGDWVVLKVHDTGRGIAQKDLPRIFDPFFTTKGLGKGSGLGLSMSLGIVRNHGGHLFCETNLGKGSCFMVYLPARELVSQQKIRKVWVEQARPPRGNETLLLVDDLKDLLHMGSRVLRSAGYQVLTAASGEEALKVFERKKEQIDLIVMDLGMPGMGGQKALLEIHKQDAQAKVIIASGYSRGQQLQQALNAGASGFVAKPYLPEELLQKVRDVLDG
ncbi:response regulator [Dethiosulfatarculus sandiegensis]|uniref:response regulator n=1 Tax=Dethiosulfatarculus sandiegensis TaxID=1429043 RepID=UPI0009EA2C04|nr:response regulator [Dethiosulfatarculus sandiegensis]